MYRRFGPPPRRFISRRALSNPVAKELRIRRIKAYAKRLERKRNMQIGRQMIIRTNNSPVPKKAVVTHVYSESQDFQITPAAAAVSEYVFAANGLYDPDVTGVGHQPMLFDQLAALYDHYTVIGAKIQVWMLNQNTTTKPQVGFINLQDNVTGVSNDPDTFIEQSRGVQKPLTTYDSGSWDYMELKFSPKDFFTKKNMLDADELRGSGSSNPTELAYFNVGIHNLDSSQIPSSTHVKVKITYQAVWTEPKDAITVS